VTEAAVTGSWLPLGFVMRLAELQFASIDSQGHRETLAARLRRNSRQQSSASNSVDSCL